ncbi:hypothetical protein Tco_1199472, partial [Tanacetum coccineum]
MDIYNAAEFVVFKAPKTSTNYEKKASQGKKLGAKFGQRKQILVIMNHPQSKIEETKGVSSLKKATGSPTGHLKKKKKSYSAKDLNLSQPPTSTHVVARLHKEAQQATGGSTSLGVTSEVRADPQITSVASTSTTKPVFLASTIIHSESASRHDALTDSTAKADPRKSAPNDSISQQQ